MAAAHARFPCANRGCNCLLRFDDFFCCQACSHAFSAGDDYCCPDGTVHTQSEAVPRVGGLGDPDDGGRFGAAAAAGPAGSQPMKRCARRSCGCLVFFDGYCCSQRCAYTDGWCCPDGTTHARSENVLKPREDGSPVASPSNRGGAPGGDVPNVNRHRYPCSKRGCACMVKTSDSAYCCAQCRDEPEAFCRFPVEHADGSEVSMNGAGGGAAAAAGAAAPAAGGGRGGAGVAGRGGAGGRGGGGAQDAPPRPPPRVPSSPEAARQNPPVSPPRGDAAVPPKAPAVPPRVPQQAPPPPPLQLQQQLEQDRIADQRNREPAAIIGNGPPPRGGGGGGGGGRGGGGGGGGCCRFYNGRPGSCRNGAACPYGHDDHNNNNNSNAIPANAGGAGAGAAVARCARQGCPCDSFNGQPGKHCSRSCRDRGQPCGGRWHPFQGGGGGGGGRGGRGAAGGGRGGGPAAARGGAAAGAAGADPDIRVMRGPL